MSVEGIAPKLGCTSETLRRWVRQAELDAGVPGPAFYAATFSARRCRGRIALDAMNPPRPN